MLALLLMLMSSSASFSQLPTGRPAISYLISSIDSSSSRLPQEKPYLHFDKPYYAFGDTMWFKAYLLQPTSYSTRSGILYADIANDSGKLISQYRLIISNGLCPGNIPLDTTIFTEGNYTLRAYTSWMRNFPEEQYWYSHFYITGKTSHSWLVQQATEQQGNDSLRLHLQFSNWNKSPLSNTTLQIKELNGKKVLHKGEVQTNKDGQLSLNLLLPQKTASLALTATDKGQGKTAVVPIILRRPQNTDIQFMAEGGQPVAGIPIRIGFKAIAEDGRSVEVTGEVRNSKQETVTTFRSIHKGMGSFVFTPKEGENYTAILSQPIQKSYPLPAVKSTGTVLQLDRASLIDDNNDSLAFTISASIAIAGSSNNYYLIGQSAGEVGYAAIINFSKAGSSNKSNNSTNTKSYTINIPKSVFLTGITRFTLFNNNNQPLNERLVFINHHDNLRISINTDQPNYNPRDSIALHISINDADGKPSTGSFSLAVTDDSQVKQDSLRTNIISHIQLSSELKGYVEEPGYYFLEGQQAEALDNLLLTQGWISYNWEQVFHPGPIAYPAEPQYMIKGRVSNIFNKAIANSQVLLYSRRPVFLKTAISDKAGMFSFSDFPALDTPRFLIQAKNKKDKSNNVGIDMIKETPAPLFHATEQPSAIPWYINSDSTLLHYTQARSKEQEAAEARLALAEGLLLPNVTVTAKKKIEGSFNLNGPGQADQVLNAADMDKDYKMTLLDICRKQIKGFNTTGGISINMTPLKLIVDGVNAAIVGIQIMDILESFTAEDIKGIEVMYHSSYSWSYDARFVNGARSGFGHIFAYLEITTRSGQGPDQRNTAGYSFKSLPRFSKPAQFYSPRYPVKDSSNHDTDLRALLYWDPNITTDSTGKAVVWFYAADKPIDYTITLQGCDIYGNLGSRTSKINIAVKKK